MTYKRGRGRGHGAQTDQDTKFERDRRGQFGAWRRERRAYCCGGACVVCVCLRALAAIEEVWLRGFTIAAYY